MEGRGHGRRLWAGPHHGGGSQPAGHARDAEDLPLRLCRQAPCAAQHGFPQARPGAGATPTPAPAACWRCRARRAQGRGSPAPTKTPRPPPAWRRAGLQGPPPPRRLRPQGRRLRPRCLPHRHAASCAAQSAWWAEAAQWAGGGWGEGCSAGHGASTSSTPGGLPIRVATARCLPTHRPNALRSLQPQPSARTHLAALQLGARHAALQVLNSHELWCLHHHLRLAGERGGQGRQGRAGNRRFVREECRGRRVQGARRQQLPMPLPPSGRASECHPQSWPAACTRAPAAGPDPPCAHLRLVAADGAHMEAHQQPRLAGLRGNNRG